MLQVMEENNKKERTIRSETTKVFLVIFAILTFVGGFTIYSAVKASNTFSVIREVHLKQFRAAELMKQRALDIISIYYILATDQDQELLMKELMRYDGLIANFEASSKQLQATYNDEGETERIKVLGLLATIKATFDTLNDNCRRMTFAMMEGKKEESKKHLPAINSNIAKFKEQIDSVEKVVEASLDTDANHAQALLKNIVWLGIVITILSIFVTLGLIYYLMQFLSLTLLPISNLMNNMRQAVFSIDKNLNIISPVSQYSNTVFAKDIVGKSINDIIYKEVDQKAEAFSANKMALDVVFDADELQWMLQEDGLMRQVKRTINIDGADQEKILKLTYTPLMENDLVKNIMIVVEDVTEVEKLRTDALKKQAEMEVIRGVIGVDLSDLEAFLTGSQQQMIESRSLLPKIGEDKESRQLLFRIMHTLKGNSRMYKLNAISEVVHLAESLVVEMNRLIDGGEKITNEQINDLVIWFNKIEDVLALHGKMARKFFGLTDLYSARMEEQLHHSFMYLEMMLSNQSTTNTLEEFKTIIDQAQKCSLYFENEYLTELLEKALSSREKSPEAKEKICLEIGEEYLKLLQQNNLIKVYTKESANWISLFQCIVNLAKEIKNKKGPASPNLKQLVDELMALSQSENIGFMRLNAFKLSKIFAEESEYKEEEVKTIMTSIWKFMTSICALESSYLVDESKAQELRSALHKTIDGNVDLDQITPLKILVVSLLRSLERKSITPNEFWQISSSYLGAATTKECVDAYIGVQMQGEMSDELLLFIKDGSTSAWKNAIALTNERYPLHDLISKEHESAQLKLDILRMFETFKPKSDASLESGEQKIELPVTCFNEIKALANDLFKDQAFINDAKIQKLHSVIQHAFDYPIQALCRKMEPMVADLSKRMGKDIQFKVSGENLALARDTAYSLRDALVHIVRNSLDHGIETPEERISYGKAPRACLEINIQRHKDNYIEIMVRDDGRGIDAERVLKKAVSTGNISEADSLKLSYDEQLQLIFLPNLSTKEEVTALSGRGVGMDAVKNVIESLGGNIKLSSNKNMGTEIRMFIADV